MPELASERVDGDGRVGLKKLRGKVVVVNAWASWCGPCRAEAPGLSRVHEELRAKGLRVVGVDADVSVEAARSFEKDAALVYPSLHDPQGRQLLRLPKGVVRTVGYPFTIIVDPEGRIVAARIGAIGEAELKRLVAPLLPVWPAPPRRWPAPPGRAAGLTVRSRVRPPRAVVPVALP